MKIQRFKEIEPLNELKKSEDGDYIERLTIGEFINILKEYDSNKQIIFSYNGDEGYISCADDGEILSKWGNEKDGGFQLHLIYY